MSRTLFLFTFLLLVVYSTGNCIFSNHWNDTSGLFNVDYTIDCTLGTISFNIVAHSLGWSAIGINNQTAMIYGDIWMGRVDCHGNPFVYDFRGTYENTAPRLDFDTGGTYDLWNISQSSINGISSFSFTRYLNTGDPYGDMVISPGFPGYFLHSFRNNSDNEFNYHGSNRGIIPYDFFATAPSCCSNPNLTAPNVLPHQPILNTTLPNSYFVTPVPSAPASDSCVWNRTRLNVEDGGTFWVDFTFDCTSGIFYANFHSAYNGWIGFGINPNVSSMFGADFIIGYFPCDNTILVGDYNLGPATVSNTERYPYTDAVNNVLTSSFSRNENGTTLSFSRFFNTGDPSDNVVKPGLSNYFFAYRMDDLFAHHEQRYPLNIDLFEGAPSCCINRDYTQAGTTTAPTTAAPTTAAPTTTAPTTAAPTTVASPTTPGPTIKSGSSALHVVSIFLIGILFLGMLL